MLATTTSAALVGTVPDGTDYENGSKSEVGWLPPTQRVNQPPTISTAGLTTVPIYEKYLDATVGQFYYRNTINGNDPVLSPDYHTASCEALLDSHYFNPSYVSIGEVTWDIPVQGSTIPLTSNIHPRTEELDNEDDM